MKLQYLGTAAAEAMPAVFCHCDTCRRAREAGGKDIRGRTGCMIDDTTMIDFPPDIYMTSLRFGLDLGNVRDIFITHSHTDHFDIQELSKRYNGMFCHLGKDTPNVHLYGNDGVAREYREFRDGPITSPDFADFTETEYGGQYVSESGLRFTYLPARHLESERSGMYMVEGGGKRVLYAHDTGIFPDAVYPMIEGKRFDLVSFDCCFGKLSAGISSHMGIPENKQMADELRRRHCIDENTIVVISHFSHNCGQLQSELEQEAAPYGFVVAYDGMIVHL